MCRYRMGNPKKSSRFICLHHLGINHVADGLQRGGKQREKNHVKDIFCVECNAVEKCLEIRYCDDVQEMMDKAEKLHKDYYEKVG